MPGDEEAGWVTTDQLLDVAHGAGYTEFTARQLETWRHEKLIPRPHRISQDGRRPVWLSPPATVEAVLELCALRFGARRHRRAVDHTSLRLHGWLRGADVGVGEARAGLLTVLDDIQRTLDTELAAITRREHLDGPPADVQAAAIAHLAHQAAASRRLHELLPRPRSVSGAHREHCLHALLYAFYTGQPPPPDIGADLERALEPVLGLRPLRGAAPLRGHRPDRARGRGEPDTLDTLTTIASLPALRRAVATASDDELRHARDTTAPFLRGLTWIARAIAAAYDDHDLAGFRLLARRPRYSYHETIILALVLSLQRSTLREDFARTVESVTDTAGTIHRFLEIVTGPGRVPDAEKLPGEPWMNRVVDELMTSHEAPKNTDGRQP